MYISVVSVYNDTKQTSIRKFFNNLVLKTVFSCLQALVSAAKLFKCVYINSCMQCNRSTLRAACNCIIIKQNTEITIQVA